MHFRWTSSVGNPLRSPGGGAKGWARCAAAGLGLALLPFMALTLVTEAPAHASGTTLYAYADGGLPTAMVPPASCPSTTTTADQCTLAEALTAAATGDTIDLATPGTTPYYGNWDVTGHVTISAGVRGRQPDPGRRWHKWWHVPNGELRRACAQDGGRERHGQRHHH